MGYSQGIELTRLLPASRKLLRSDSGFALPSILFLLTILSVVALSIISLVAIQRRLTLREIARVRAEYAAQSGIVVSCARPSQESRNVPFEDGSAATVETFPWGMYRVVSSVGRSGSESAVRTAIIAMHPPPDFQRALVFSNAKHELVLAGGSSITGDIVTGPAGAATGRVKNVTSSSSAPIKGKIIKEAAPILPSFDGEGLRRDLSKCQALLGTREGLRMVGSPGTESGSPLGRIPDSVGSAYIVGDVQLADSIARRDKPLTIAVEGRLTLLPGVSLLGLVRVYATKEIIVSRGVNVEHAILMSKVRIDFKSGARIIGQVIAPAINMDTNAVAAYPSAIVSLCVDPLAKNQGIRMLSGSCVEGAVISVGAGSSPQIPTLDLRSKACVIGVVYSEGNITLQGTVIGSVFAHEFCFYEAPTQYLGWIKDGVIDRASLPSGFLVPMTFSPATTPDVLDWL